MTFPALIFGIVMATLYGALFHFWKGGGLGRLFLYLILSWLGFISGHMLAGALGWTFGAIGPLYAGLGSLISFLFLLVGDWLSQVEVTRKK